MPGSETTIGAFKEAKQPVEETAVPTTIPEALEEVK